MTCTLVIELNSLMYTYYTLSGNWFTFVFIDDLDYHIFKLMRGSYMIDIYTFLVYIPHARNVLVCASLSKA